MIATDGNHPRTVLDGILAFLAYGLFFWRMFKSNPGNRLVECGSLTVIVFLTLIFLDTTSNVPGWLFGTWLLLVVSLCFATLFFLFQRMFRAVSRRSNQ